MNDRVRGTYTKSVTKEVVEKVKGYLSSEKYSNLTNLEIGLLCSTSATTVSRIKNGEYDYLLCPEEKVEDKKSDEGVSTFIPYDTLKHLMACEYAIETILKNCKLSTGYDGALFVDYKVVYGVLNAYLPEETSRRLADLKAKEEEDDE